MDTGLIEAYRRTRYCVDLDDGSKECLRVGERSAWLDRQLASAGQPSAIFITAENPGSKSLTDEENGRRTAALRKLLTIAGYQILTGYGKGQNDDWPQEESFLVLGASRKDGLDFARRFEQNAFLFAMPGEAVELVFADNE
jgi:hypothetical protein